VICDIIKKFYRRKNVMRDLYARIPGAVNFTYGEFIKSDTAIRLGIENVPNEAQWQAIERLAVNILQPIRDQFGRVNITSGFRSVELCIAIGSFRTIGGKPTVTSNHARGQAADIEPDDPSIPLIDILNFINNECDYRELIAEYFPGGWVHVAYRENANDRLLKLKDPNHNFARVEMDYINAIYKMKQPN